MNKIENLKLFTESQIRNAAQVYTTPFYLYSEKKIIENVKYMHSLPKSDKLTIRYSIKAQPNRYILQLMNSLGLHFDASSQWEAMRAIHAGIKPERILLTSQEFGSSVAELIKSGVLFDAGSLYQIEQYGKLFPNSNITLRINPGFGSGLINKLTSGGKNSSFGIWHEEIVTAKAIVEKYKLNVERLHIHIGSGHRPEILLDCLKKLLEFAELFPSINIINLGGGYKIKSFMTDEQINYHKIFSEVKHKIDAFSNKICKTIHTEIEPGTFLVANAGSIISEVIDIVHTGLSGHKFIKINAGLTEIIRPSFYGAAHPLVVVNKDSYKKEYPLKIDKFCVIGHCCIAGDVLTTQYTPDDYLKPQLLALPQVGDYLVIERGGGYCASMCLKNFNSYPEAAEVMCKPDGKLMLIRKRQTLEQIIQNENVMTTIEENYHD